MSFRRLLAELCMSAGKSLLAAAAQLDPWSSGFSGDFGADVLPVVTPSPNDTVIMAGSAAAIIDAKGNRWTVSAAGIADENGRAVASARPVAKLAYVGGVVWCESGLTWHSKTASGWSAGTTVSPLPGLPPGQVTGLHVTAMTGTSVSLAWNPPKTGTPPFQYTVFYRCTGAAYWAVGTVCTADNATVAGLKPATSYQIEIVTHN
jgi:Fibronectin type III domain